MNIASIRKALRILYLAAVLLLTITMLMALYDGGYQIAGGLMAGIAFASVIVSLLPYFFAMLLFKKYEKDPESRKRLKTWGWIVYVLCFPAMGWMIYSNIDVLFHGRHWAFG